MTECIFCKIIERTIPSYWIDETEHTFAFLDINPVSKGHTLVIPKVHAAHYTQGSQESAEQIMVTVYRLAPAIMKALGADGFNFGMNEGECAGQIVMHTHVHIMPRWNGMPRTFTKIHASPEDLAATAQAIRDVLATPVVHE
jgi:histidine triad (HIT) family protein